MIASPVRAPWIVALVAIGIGFAATARDATDDAPIAKTPASAPVPPPPPPPAPRSYCLHGGDCARAGWDCMTCCFSGDSVACA